MAIHQTDWKEEHSKFLADNMTIGGSYADIAKTMNEKFSTSYTRNALIGRAARMGLKSSHKQTYEPRKPQVYKPRVRKPPAGRPDALAFEPVETIALRCAEIEPRNLSLMDLEPNDCRYPYGQGAQITFCGHAKAEGSSYCSAHFHLTRGRGTTSERSATWGVNRLVGI